MLRIKYLMILFCIALVVPGLAQSGDSIRVLFIYGSRPAKPFKNAEIKWFGGIRGGHAAIQYSSNQVFSFRSTLYPCHFFERHFSKNFASVFEIKTVHDTWETFPRHNYIIDSLQRAIVTIPITALQRAKLTALIQKDTAASPYDYATLGMRCASATYDVLQELGLVEYHKHGNWIRIFTTRSLRTILFDKATDNRHQGWRKQFFPGGKRRVWESDK